MMLTSVCAMRTVVASATARASCRDMQARGESFQAASCMEGPRPEYTGPPGAPPAALQYAGTASGSSGGGSYNLESEFRCSPTLTVCDVGHECWRPLA